MVLLFKGIISNLRTKLHVEMSDPGCFVVEIDASDVKKKKII